MPTADPSLDLHAAHPRPRRGRSAALGLLLACHPMPSLAVTTFATAYASTVGSPAGRLPLLAAAVLTGQLAVGWSNDAIDAEKDRVAGRRDKPIATGVVDARTVARAAGCAAVATVVLSLLLGAAAGGLHLLAVGLAVGYNARLKSTLLSPVPYLAAFGLLPVVAWNAAGVDGLPPFAHVLAALLLGGAAHAGNTVGDAAADALTGVRGLPQRLGPARSMTAMAVLVAAAAIVLLVELTTGPSPQSADSVGRTASFGMLVGGALLAVAGAAMYRSPARDRSGPNADSAERGPGAGAFRLTLAAVALVVAGFLLSA